MINPSNIQTYIDKTLSGKSGAGELEVLSVQRFINDINQAPELGLIFDKKAAERVIKFFDYLKHGKGSDFAGRPFVLSPWQQFNIYNKYGWKRADGRRRFRTGYLDVARKNGKTTLAAGESLYLLAADGEAGAEVYSVATKREQAAICLTEAKNILRYSPKLRGVVQTLAHAITSERSGSTFKSLSSDSSTLDGLNPHGITVDEFHAHRDSSLIDVMRSAMGARLDPLMNIITTAGFNKMGPCFQYRHVAIQILRGQIRQDDTFVQIFTLDDADDYQNPDVWRKANPNMGISLKGDFLKDELQAVINNPAGLVNFLTKHMNRWVDAEKTWIPDAEFTKCNLAPVVPDGRPRAFGGLDLANVRDIAAYCLAIPGPDDVIDLFWRFYVPEDNVAERVRKDKIPYDQWIRDGYIIATPGNVTDYNFIEADIHQMHDMFNIQSSAYDRWNSSQLIINLTSSGIKMNGFGQGFASMSSPTKEFEKRMLTKKINTGGNPVARWMLSNVALQRDPAGNIKPDKNRSVEKIDGIVAAIMAIGEYMSYGNMRETDINQIYKDRGIRML